MIGNDVGFLADASKPYAHGGLIGGLFFAGYMLTQWPGGYLGDRYGHRTMIAVGLVWAGIATLLSGVITGLAFGITIATAFAPNMIDLGGKVFAADEGGGCRS
jgi:MFS transporter, ACS family, D-galactonate transporter